MRFDYVRVVLFLYENFVLKIWCSAVVFQWMGSLSKLNANVLHGNVFWAKYPICVLIHWCKSVLVFHQSNFVMIEVLEVRIKIGYGGGFCLWFCEKAKCLKDPWVSNKGGRRPTTLKILISKSVYLEEKTKALVYAQGEREPDWPDMEDRIWIIWM